MLVGRSSKDFADRSRVVINFIDWLDPGEGISAITAPTIALGEGLWSAAPGPLSAAPDTDPLIVFSSELFDANTKLRVLFDEGTPGLIYTATCIATGSTSGRRVTVKITMVVQSAMSGLQPAPAPSIYPSSPLGLAADTLWSNGGVLCVVGPGPSRYPTDPAWLRRDAIWNNGGVLCVVI